MKAELSWLDDPRVYQVNRLAAHSDHCFYEEEEANFGETSTLIQSLTGTWDFQYLPYPELPSGFGEEAQTPEGFGTIQVPGHIELAGYHPIHYTNSDYPWEGKIFRRPAGSLGRSAESGTGDFSHAEDNPVGLYHRTFRWDPTKEQDGAILRFEGAEQALYVWMNGTFIGYAEDSFTPSEFDVSHVIRQGENHIHAAVFRHCTASWVEDQDFFRFFGLFRDVKVITRPSAHVEDLHVIPTVDPESRIGRVELKIRLRGAESVQQVLFQLKDPSGKSIRTWSMDPSSFHDAENGIRILEFTSGDLENVSLWEEFVPELYTMEVRLMGENGLIEKALTTLGFRSLSVENGVVRLNGRRLKICGVNRHEWSAEKGRAISMEEMQQDMECLLRNNINAVRTCHYPDQTEWYHLCDAHGIYVMAEVNMESHGSWQKYGANNERSWNIPGSLDCYREMMLDRAKSNYEMLKNHPSVLFWSLGNESNAGDVIRDMNAYYKRVDPLRMTHYESVYYTPEYRGSISDFESRMYASPDVVTEYLESHPDKPYILCEFMHDMGNSMGGLRSYMELFDRYPMYTGGFIWDMIDQALMVQDEITGMPVLRYGGDFDDRHSDLEFSGNGILFADRQEKPAMQEVRELYGRYVRRKPEKSSSADMEDVGSVGDIPASVQIKTVSQPLHVVFGDSDLGIHGSHISWLFNYAKGGPESLILNGVEWIYRVPKPTFWRATTCNDRGNGFHGRSSQWLGANLVLDCEEIRVLRDGRLLEFPKGTANNQYSNEEYANTVEIQFDLRTKTIPATKVEVDYHVYGDGECRVTVKYHGCAGLPELPVLGWRLIAPTAADEFLYKGLSGETYPDRMEGGRPGIYRVKGMPVAPYLVPQECGNHMNTHWLRIHRSTSLKNTQSAVDSALTITMDPEHQAFSVLPYTAEELENATHMEELPPVRRTVICINGCVRGVGGIDSWGSDVEKEYHISAEEDHEFSFVIS